MEENICNEEIEEKLFLLNPNGCLQPLGFLFEMRYNIFSKLKTMSIIKLSKDQKEKFIHFPIKHAVYVSSIKNSENSDKEISYDELVNRADEVSRFLADLFGGYSSYDISGGFVLHKKHKDIVKKEKIIRIVSFSTKKNFIQNQNKLFGQISFWAKKWGQKYIGYEYEDDLYYIPR